MPYFYRSRALTSAVLQSKKARGTFPSAAVWRMKRGKRSGSRRRTRANPFATRDAVTATVIKSRLIYLYPNRDMPYFYRSRALTSAVLQSKKARGTFPSAAVGRMKRGIRSGSGQNLATRQQATNFGHRNSEFPSAAVGRMKRGKRSGSRRRTRANALSTPFKNTILIQRDCAFYHFLL